MIEKADRRVAGLVVFETRPSHAGNALGTGRDPDGTLAEFLAYLTGSDRALRAVRRRIGPRPTLHPRGPAR